MSAGKIINCPREIFSYLLQFTAGEGGRSEQTTKYDQRAIPKLIDGKETVMPLTSVKGFFITEVEGVDKRKQLIVE